MFHITKSVIKEIQALQRRIVQNNLVRERERERGDQHEEDESIENKIKGCMKQHKHIIY